MLTVKRKRRKAENCFNVMGLASDKILNVLLDSLSVEELEAALAQKRGVNSSRPKPMTEKERLKEHYSRLIIAMGILHPPQAH